jgi:molybdate transport system substrate-binding protein
VSLAGRPRRGRGRLGGVAVALVLAASVLGAVVVACSDAEDDDLTVFAAASLRDVFAELETAWAETRPGAELTVALDSSNVLAAQIAEGAAADVFASADRRRPAELEAAGATAGSPQVFARNGITLVVPTDTVAVQEPADLADPGVRLVAAGPSVPISGYADAAIEQLAARQPDPGAWAAAVRDNVVSREDNVRAALAKVELGEGDAALVYRTDAASSPATREIPLDGIEVVADYSAVAISDRPAAAEFVAWLRGPEAAAILEAAGFEAATP